MLTADIKIDGTIIAKISAQNIGQAPGALDAPSDFGSHQPRIYVVDIERYSGKYERYSFQVEHDRLYGWEGLLRKICDRAGPMIIETVTVDDGVKTQVKMEDTEAGNDFIEFDPPKGRWEDMRFCHPDLPRPDPRLVACLGSTTKREREAFIDKERMQMRSD